MYMIYNIDHIHHIFNKSKIKFFVYNSDDGVYMLSWEGEI